MCGFCLRDVPWIEFVCCEYFHAALCGLMALSQQGGCGARCCAKHDRRQQLLWRLCGLNGCGCQVCNQLWFSQAGNCYSLFLLTPTRYLIYLSLSLSLIVMLTMCIPLPESPQSHQWIACASSLWCARSTPQPSCPSFCCINSLLAVAGALGGSAALLAAGVFPHPAWLISGVMVAALWLAGDK